MATSPRLTRETVKDLSRLGVRVQADQSLGEAALVMLRQNVGTVPVCDESGRPVGLVTRHMLLNGAADAKVRDVMAPCPVCIPSGADLTAGAQMMLSHQYDSLPVVEDGRLVGVVTRTDLVRAFLH